MLKSHRWYFIVAAFVVLGAVVGWNFASGPTSEPAFHSDARSDTDSSSDTGPSSETSSHTSDDAAVWSHGHDGPAKNAEEHWKKHGEQFPEDHTARDYEQDAQQFVQHPPPGTEIKHRDNGDTLLYNPGTNTFAVTDGNGAPRTMFKPDRGESYWARQH